MNKTLLITLVLMNGNAFATDSLKIYSSLDVKEKFIPGPRTELTYEKSVGGLTCTKTSSVVGGDVIRSTQATCSITHSKLNFEKIYYSLNQDVKEEDITDTQDEVKHQKSVGGLVCTKTNRIIGGDALGPDKVHCDFKF